MDFWTYLDRMGERRARRPRFDSRIMVGALFLLGYYALAWKLTSAVLPPESAPLLRDMLLVLGPAVGLIVGAMFRTDRRDEQAAQNTGQAFSAVREAIAAQPAAPIIDEERTQP